MENRKENKMIWLMILISLIIPVFFIVCNIKLTSPTEIVNIQDDIRTKIINNEDFDVDYEIERLKNHIYIDYSINGLNPVSTNNIAVRHHMLLAALYYLKDNEDKKFLKEYYKTIELITFNIVEKGIWSEGPSYYLYVEEMLDAYKKIVNEPDSILDEFKKDCREWISKYITPDDLLPPIGETRRTKCNFSEYNNKDTIIFDGQQTLIKENDLYVFIRHPTINIKKYQNNGHIHYDIGNICIYKGKKCIVLPIGYPGYDVKQKENLWKIENENSIFLDTLYEPLWRFLIYNLKEVKREKNLVSVSYEAILKNLNRIISIEDNIIMIRDNGSDGINLNMADDGYKIHIYIGGELKVYKGKHSEGHNKILENKRIFIPAKDNITSIGIELL